MIKTDDILKLMEQYRKDRDLSLGDFADKCGVSKAYLSQLNNHEKEVVSLNIAQMILEAAGYELKIVSKS